MIASFVSKRAPLAFLTVALVAAAAHAGVQAGRPLFAGNSVCEPPLPTAALATSSPAQSGEVVITEFMKDPSFVADSKGEWFEVLNVLAWRVNLDGWVLSDDSGQHHTLSSGGTTRLILRPGQRFVLGINGDPAQNGGIAVDYVYSGFTLTNSADQIILSKADGTLVDRVDYDSVQWPSIAGHSLTLQPAYTTVYYNDDPGEWCSSSSPISASNPDTGTPGGLNDICP